MSKRPGNSLDFFLSKQTRVENDLSSENELDESLTIAKNNSLSLDHSNEDLSITAHPNHMDIGLFVTENQSVDEDKECFEAIKVIAALSYCRNRSRNGYLAMHLG